MFCNRKIAPTPASMQVHVSAALYGNEIAMLTLLSDLERHVQPNLTVVHISKGSPTLSAANLRQWELAPKRTLFNPDRRHVHRGRPSVLVAHLSNLFMLARRRPAIADEDKVVLVAGNQRFFRSCREHLLSTTLSFMIGQLVDLRCGSDCDKPSHVFAKPTTYPSSEFARHVRKIRQERDTFLDIHPYHKGFVRVMRNMVNGTSRVDNVTSWLPRIWSDDADAASVAFPRAKPLTFMPHEGTFYPFGLLRAFLREVGASVMRRFGHADNSNSSAAPPPKCVWLGRGSPAPCGHESVEEELLPTYIWQRHLPSLLLRNATLGPPMVARVWLGQKAKQPRNMTAALALLRPWLRTPSSYICAIKLPHSQLNNLGW